MVWLIWNMINIENFRRTIDLCRRVALMAKMCFVLTSAIGQHEKVAVENGRQHF